MKKSFLIAGLIAVIGVPDGYAIQSGALEITCTCTQGCTCMQVVMANGQAGFECDFCPDGVEPVPRPNIVVRDLQETSSPNSNNNNVAQQTSLNKQNITKKQNKVSARIAEMPKVTKKIVYEEIISDDAE